MKNNSKPYLATFSILIYSISVMVSLLPEFTFLQVFQDWWLGDNSSFGYPNFYWVASNVVLIITHQSFIDTSPKINLTMLSVLCFMLILSTVIAANTSKVDGYLLRLPPFLIGLTMVSSTLMNNYSLKNFDRKCQLVSLTDLEDKEFVDFFHTVIFAIGVGSFYIIVSG